MDKTADTLLACCHGFRVSAADRPLGVVETPVFSGTRLQPDYLIVRTDASMLAGFADVPVELVREIDEARRTISLSACVGEILRFNLSRATPPVSARTLFSSAASRTPSPQPPATWNTTEDPCEI